MPLLAARTSAPNDGLTKAGGGIQTPLSKGRVRSLDTLSSTAGLKIEREGDE